MVGEYTLSEMEYFKVKDIPGHGNFTFKFKIVDIKSSEAGEENELTENEEMFIQ